MLSSYLLVAIIPWYAEGTFKKMYISGKTKIRHLINHNNRKSYYFLCDDDNKVSILESLLTPQGI